MFRGFIEQNKAEYPYIEHLIIQSDVKNVPFSEELSESLEKLKNQGILPARINVFEDGFEALANSRNLFLTYTVKLDETDLGEQDARPSNQFSFTLALEEYPTLMTIFLSEDNPMKAKFIDEMNRVNLEVKFDESSQTVKFYTQSHSWNQSESYWREKFPEKYLYGFLINFHTRIIQNKTHNSKLDIRQLKSEIVELRQRLGRKTISFWQDTKNERLILTGLAEDFAMTMFSFSARMRDLINSSFTDFTTRQLTHDDVNINLYLKELEVFLTRTTTP
jgi:hypothetical protein